MPWSIENELVKVTNTNSIIEAVGMLNIQLENTTKFSITIVRDWYRSGAETYGLAFEIAPENAENPKRFFLKACCPSSVGIPIDTILNKWLERRAILENLGVKVPELFVSGEGIIVEEFIYEELTQGAVNDTNRHSIKNDIEKIANALILAKFSPINPFGNLMLQSNNVIWVDFGTDLGSQNSKSFSASSIANYTLMKLHELQL